MKLKSNLVHTMAKRHSLRFWFREIHRHLSFFYVGVIVVYSISGFMLNHKHDFNPNYTLEHKTLTIEGQFPKSHINFTEFKAKEVIKSFDNKERFAKMFFQNEESAKIFLRGGSSIVVNLTTGEALYEALRNRPIIYSMNKLHLNPSRTWTIFSDIFIASLLIITLTGVFIVKGKRGLWGIGGIELLLGIIIPIIILMM